MEYLALLAVVGIVLWLVLGKRQHARQRIQAAVEDESQSIVEGLTLRYLGEHPRLTDEQIATLVQDDLHNHRIRTPAVFRWATAETAGRLRRTVLRASLEQEQQQGGSPKKEKRRAARMNAEKQGTVAVVRLKRCRECRVKNKGDAYRCSKCGAVFGS